MPGPDACSARSTPPQRGGAISFELDGVHPHDVAQVLDSRGIAVRAGHHCAKPAHARFGVQSSTRMSSYLYTTPAEIDALVEGLEYTRSLLQVGLSSDHGPRCAVPGDHPGPLQEPPPQGPARPFEAEVHHVNPTCGDEVTLRVHLADGVVEDVSYDAVGCSISQASASVMTDLRDRQAGRRGDGDPRGVPRP